MPVRPLSPELAEKARVELNEDPKKLEDGIQHLRDWVDKQPHLRARTDDQWLATFLRGSKFSLERAKEKLDLYYTIRNHMSDLNVLKHTDPKFMEILKLGVILALPKVKNPADPRVMFGRMGVYEADKYTMGEVMSVGIAMQRIMFLEDDNFVVAGAVNVMDFKDATLGHLTAMTPAQMKKIVVASQEAAPLRMKGSHYLNVPAGFETILNIVKKFLNEKNRNRLYVYSKDYSGLYENVSKEILPVEYGGNGGTIQGIIDYWVKKIQEYSAWLEEDDKYGTDEALRPGKPKTAEDMFGVDGSFRQLEFD